MSVNLASVFCAFNTSCKLFTKWTWSDVYRCTLLSSLLVSFLVHARRSCIV